MRSPSKSTLNEAYIVICVILIAFLGVSTNGFCSEKDGQCSTLREKWENLHAELKDKLNGFVALQQQPVDKIIQRPLVSPSSGKTIARQISEALQVKEDLLAEKRLDCRKLMEAEKQAFEELEQCMGAVRNKNRDLVALEKNRKALLDKALTTLAEVKEVEGRETIVPYAEWNGQGDRYRQSLNNYWQSYEQNYRRWWGY